MTKIAVVHPELGKDYVIASLWAGPGADADPIKRLEGLILENQVLKRELEKAFPRGSTNDK
jgi:hypothetical protein